MTIRARVGFATTFIAGLLLSASVQAAIIHLQIDPQKSELSATVPDPLARFRDTGGEVEAKFRITSGEVEGDPQNPGTTGHVKLTIDATTFDSGNNHRDNVVLGTALNTAEYQTISFESTHLENIQIDSPGKMGHVIVAGNLTLHGTTAEIRVPADVSLATDGTLEADGEVSFDYTYFGVRVPRLLFAIPAGKEVTIHFHIVAAQPNGTATEPAAPSPG